MSIEAMKQALGALEAMNPYPASKEGQRTEAIAALRQAIEQAEQAQGQSRYCFECERLSRELAALKAEQESVIECDCETQIHADGSRETRCGSDPMRHAVGNGSAFRLRPPPRQRLAEPAIRTIRCNMAGTLDVQYVAFARAIEAAHGIKEGGAE